MRTILLLLCLAMGAPATATNISFYPGDAFFSARLTEEVAEKFRLCPGEQELHYEYPPDSGDFGGYAGFERIVLTDLDVTFCESLSNAYRSMRRRVPKLIRVRETAESGTVSEEINGFPLFVYNHDLKWTTHHIGIKYNESWASPPAESIHWVNRGGFARVLANSYQPFLPLVDAVTHDWKFSAEVPALGVQCSKDIDWGVAGPPITAPVRIAAKEIQLIILPSIDALVPLFQREDGSYFWIVTSETVVRCEWRDGELLRQNIPGQR